MTVQAISPQEVARTKQGVLPDAVVSCWNTLIAKHSNGGRVSIPQSVAVAALMEAMRCESRQEVFTGKWLEIEPLYEARGWKVTYDRPGFNESGDAIFYFSPSDRGGENS